MRLTTLKKSVEFRRVRGGRRSGTDAFLIEGKERSAGPAENAGENCDVRSRFGFTVTKKLGGAVVRNKIRRRLKSVVRSLDADVVAPGHDFVVIARTGALKQPYAALAADFRRALLKIRGEATKRPAAERAETQRVDIDAPLDSSGRSDRRPADPPTRSRAARPQNR